MRDDFQIPNLGQAPASYDISFFNRFAANIEQTFNLIRSKGKNNVTYISYSPISVAALPGGVAGMTAFASNGRKAGEGAGAGTGVLVFHDGIAWRACDTGATVSA